MTRRTQHGLSLVELLIAVVISLFIAAAGSTLLASSLRANRVLLLEARLMQDLRTSADLISRNLRRAGYWGASSAGIWTRGTSGVTTNPYTALSPAPAASDAAQFHYSRDATENNAIDGNEQFGVRLRNHVLQMQLGAGNWQALTDANTLEVTAFSITPTLQDISLQDACDKPCPAAQPTCGPHLQVRSLALVISARATADAHVTRSLRSSIRVRNDSFTGICPA
ncbi:MAG: prepilin-type N-terminal cleavage/methylation domain-containing protein [Burkholderiaceae bacterium]